MIVVAGEALIDLVADADGRFRAIPGGSPANVAIGLARLGVRTEFLGRFGAGRFGDIVRAHLAGGGVGLSYAVMTAAPSTLAVVSVDDGGHATYDFYVEGTADWGWSGQDLPAALPRDALALCTGSLAVVMEPGATALTDLMRREHDRGAATVVLDPNVRPPLAGPRIRARDRVEAQVALADVVKVSEEDLSWLAPGESAERVTAGWLDRGPAMVVLTRGAQGAAAVTSGDVRVRVPAHQVDVVDTVGAGDAFTAGLVDALRRRALLGEQAHDRLVRCGERTIRDVIEHASLVAALTCARRGADPPTAAEVATVAGGLSSDT